MIHYRPDVDGLRAVSVLAVVMFHAGWGVPGGYVGVDVFFVISGFLITRLLVADLDRGSFSLARFWERRIRRIWPAAVVVTLTVLAVGGLILLPDAYRVLAGDAVAQATMLANVRLWAERGGGYFDVSSDLRPLLHMWSLAVEEQFYLLYPLILAAAWRWGRSASVGMMAAVAVASFAASVLLLPTQPKMVFYLLPFRSWELLVGGLVAMLPALRLSRDGWWRDPIGLLGLSLILVPCLWYGRQTSFPAAAAVPPCLGAALIIITGSGDGAATWVSRLLAAPPLVAIGRMSYSLYLWHWPVLAFLRYCFGVKPPSAVIAFGLVAAAILSYGSWRWVEQPFRRPAGLGGEGENGPWKTIWGAVVACGLIVAVSMTIRHCGGLPSRFSEELARFGEPKKYNTSFVHDGLPAADGNWWFPPIGVAESGQQPCFLLWGDSQSLAIVENVSRQSRELGISGVAAIMSATVPVPGAWRPGHHRFGAIGVAGARRWSEGVIGWMRSKLPRHVILCAAWSGYVPSSGNGGIASLDEAVADRERSSQTLRAGLEAVREECERIDATLWVLKEVPYQPWTARERAIAAHLGGGPIDTSGIDRTAHNRRHGVASNVIDSVASNRLRSLDLAEPFFGEDGVSRMGRGGEAWYFDETHVNTPGADSVLDDLIRGVLEEVARDCKQ